MSPAEFVPVTYAALEVAEAGEIVLRMAREEHNAVDHSAMTGCFRVIVEMVILMIIMENL